MDSDSHIHPTAIVEDGAVLGSNVRIGPFCHVGPRVTLGDDVELKSHVVVTGTTTIGKGTTVHSHAVLGGAPQNARHQGGETTLTVGSNCTIREFATISCGSDNSRGETRVGDNAFLMAYTHVAHDCILGHNVTMANYAGLAGHVEVGDYVNMGGFAAVHQFVRIGHHAFLTAKTAISGDVIPYGIVYGFHGKLRGLNVVGMRRSGMTRTQIGEAREAYRTVFNPVNPVAENARTGRDRFAGSPVATEIIDFILNREKRYFTVPDADEPGDDDAEPAS